MWARPLKGAVSAVCMGCSHRSRSHARCRLREGEHPDAWSAGGAASAASVACSRRYVQATQFPLSSEWAETRSCSVSVRSAGGREWQCWGGGGLSVPTAFSLCCQLFSWALSSFSESLAHRNVKLGRAVVLNVVTLNVCVSLSQPTLSRGHPSFLLPQSFSFHFSFFFFFFASVCSGAPLCSNVALQKGGHMQRSVIKYTFAFCLVPSVPGYTLPRPAGEGLALPAALLICRAHL